jgi:hypothetical protein
MEARTPGKGHFGPFGVQGVAAAAMAAKIRSMLVFAHAGHWIESLLILVPTVGFIGWLLIVTMRERRKERRGGGES